MQFTQPVFFLFLIGFFIGWQLFKTQPTYRLVYLVAASFAFYSFANIYHSLVLLLVCLIGYLGGIAMLHWAHNKRYLWLVSVTACLSLLIVFKYSEFLITNLVSLMAFLGIWLPQAEKLGAISVIAPLGISFYTLQAISYLVDIYHGRLQPTKNVLHFCAYLAMFPKLLAGPIERGKDLLPQLLSPVDSLTEEKRWQGTKLLVFGYFMKVVIADNLAPLVDTAFNAPVLRSESLYWWVAVTAFAIQLYGDFSGYSLIALGLGKWMGYELSPNFRHPYISSSLTEFWTRWHITLSNWLRDYIFFPLNRSRRGRNKQHANMWITMLFSGLWHGAGWQFIAWGGLHGLYISLEKVTQWPNRLKRLRGGFLLAMFFVALQVWIGWVFFRANNLYQGFQILRILFSFQGGLDFYIEPSYFIFIFLGILPSLYVLLRLDQKPLLPAFIQDKLEIILISILIVACVLLRGPGSQFIYFQF